MATGYLIWSRTDRTTVGTSIYPQSADASAQIAKIQTKDGRHSDLKTAKVYDVLTVTY